MSVFFNALLHVLKNRKFENLTDVQHQKDIASELGEKMQKRQLKLIKKQEVSTRNSVLYLNMLNETKNLVLFYVSLIKSERDFYMSIYEANPLMWNARLWKPSNAIQKSKFRGSIPGTPAEGYREASDRDNSLLHPTLPERSAPGPVLLYSAYRAVFSLAGSRQFSQPSGLMCLPISQY